MNALQNQNDLIGQKFNRLTIIGEAPHKVFPSGRKAQVEAICECGKVGIYVLAAMRNGNTKSCGCYNKERITTHGMNETRQYQTWADMKTRCDNTKHKWYPEYGGRGIGYQESWKSFEAFWEDMKDGYSDDLTLDRIENDLGYSKENCRWTTAPYQSHNQRKSKGSKNKYFGVRVDDKCDNIGVRIKREGKTLHLGTYETEELGAKAYDDAAEIIYGDRPNKTLAENDWIFEKVVARIEGHSKGEKFTASGSTFKNATITEEQAVEIYLLAHEGVLTQKQIAAKFGIIQCMVSAIKRRASWAAATKDVEISK